jgi:hypothetical protein
LVAAVRRIAEFSADRVSPDLLLPMAALLMHGNRTNYSTFSRNLARRAAANSLLSLNALLPLTDAQREPVLAGLEEAFRTQVLNASQLYTLIQADIAEAISGFGWRIVAASQTPDTLIKQVWLELLARPSETPAVRAAMQSAYALTLLARCGIRNEEVSGYMAARPFLAALLSADTFGRMAETVPVSALFALTVAMDGAVWERLRGAWLGRLQRGEGLLEFWTGMETALKSDATGRVAGRLLENISFVQTITVLGFEEADTLLRMREPALDAPLTAFVRHHIADLLRDSAVLGTIATHPFPGVRAVGIARVRELGMSLRFALRLLESGIPESVVMGREFFEALSWDAESSLGAALALCDSPVKSVRRYGREYVTARQEELPANDLLTALFENPDPETQYFVAEMVSATPAPAEIGAFERDVLRRRNTTRKAKEAIKARQEAQATVDVSMLLELARGSGTPRDAEWALSQLARRALAGEQIPGFALEGVAGV